jgi:hypothetical protein
VSYTEFENVGCGLVPSCIRCHHEYDSVFGNTRVNEYPVATPNAINAVFKPRVECLTACVLLMLVVGRPQSSCVRRACARKCVTSRGASSAFFRHSYDDERRLTVAFSPHTHARAPRTRATGSVCNDLHRARVVRVDADAMRRAVVHVVRNGEKARAAAG